MAKNLILWVIIAIVLMSVFNNFTSTQTKPQSLAYSDFITEIKQGQIKEVTISGRSIEGQTVDGQRFSTFSPGDDGLVNMALKRPEDALKAFRRALDANPHMPSAQTRAKMLERFIQGRKI